MLTPSDFISCASGRSRIYPLDVTTTFKKRDLQYCMISRISLRRSGSPPDKAIVEQWYSFARRSIIFNHSSVFSVEGEFVGSGRQ